MVDHSIAVADSLRDAGQSVRVGVFEGGHDWACWRGALLSAACFLLGET